MRFRNIVKLTMQHGSNITRSIRDDIKHSTGTVFDLISEHTLISGHPPILCWWRLLPEHVEIYVYWLCYCAASCNRYLMLINHPTDDVESSLIRSYWLFCPNCSLIRSNTVYITPSSSSCYFHTLPKNVIK